MENDNLVTLKISTVDLDLVDWYAGVFRGK